RVALCAVYQRRVVEHVLSHSRTNQEAEVESIPVDFAVEPQCEVGIGVANDAVVSLGGTSSQGRHPIDAPGRGRRTGVQLLAVRVDAEEERSVECADGLPG